MKANILIVEDEVLIANMIKRYLLQFGHDCAGIAVNSHQANTILESKKVDLVLLDITISGNKTGIDIAKIINDKYNIPFIYLTAHTDSGTINSAKETLPAGYLPKPVIKDALYATLEITLHSIENNNNCENIIDIKSGRTTYKVDLNSIQYIEADHIYIIIQFLNNKIIVRQSLSKFLETIKADFIVKINRSVAVNINNIRSYTTSEINILGENFKISNNYRQNFINQKNLCTNI